MDRRHFLATLAGSLGVSAVAGRRPIYKHRSEALGTARHVIYINLNGAPSHVDTFDAKTFSVTPQSLGIETVGGSLAWPMGLMPRLGQRTDMFSLVRSVTATEAVHLRAVFHQLSGHQQGANGEDIPHVGSLLSFLLEQERATEDSLPTFIKMGNDYLSNGFLSAAHRGLELDVGGTISNIERPYPEQAGAFNLLDALMNTPGSVNQDNRRGHVDVYKQTRRIMEDTSLRALLAGGGDYNGPNQFRADCETAVQLLKMNRGVRFIKIRQGSWDHHQNIYDPSGLPFESGRLDEGLAYLLDTLAAEPGIEKPTLLDETLVLAMGEFGRTVGDLNFFQGRDHYPGVLSALFAGGGVQPGRVIGATNSDGAYVIDPGWSHSRYISVTDVVGTVLSALGIDPQQRITYGNEQSWRLVGTVRGDLPRVIDTLFV